MKQKTRYVRRGNRIYDANTNEVKKYASINAAKRASRTLQGDKLGRGLLIQDSK